MMDSIKKGIIVVATSSLVGTPMAWPRDQSAPKAITATTAASDADAAKAASSYVIGAGDTLHVSVWGERDLTVTVPVRPDGMISLPLVNDVQAAGLTPMGLGASLKEKLKKFVDDPRVTVEVAQMNRPWVYVMGEVLRHGPITLLPEMTVLQALATSGLTPFAHTKKIYVLRSSGGTMRRFPVNYKRLLKGEGMSQNIILIAGDTVVVP